jgi:hypothetical protein
MLYPFWGNNGEAPRAEIDRYADTGRRLFQMVPLENADVAVLPADWNDVSKNGTAKNLALEFTDLAKRAGKKVAIFFHSDSDEAVPIENAIVFRTAFNHSKRRPNEFAMPALCDDFMEKYLDSRLTLRAKSEKPVVGFCGLAYSPRGSIRRVKTLCLQGHVFPAINELRILALFCRAEVFGCKMAGPYRGSFLRTRVMRVLSRSEFVETNFVVRDSFWGGIFSGAQKGDDKKGDLDLFQKVRQKVRQDYVHNMLDSDYALCVRGAGNFSWRFYEAMSCGRVPLFIDTDCGLPYDWLIDWRQQFIWVDEQDVPSVAKLLVMFHHSLSPEDFQKLQVNCRKLWEDWLSPVGFFANFYRHFER